MNRKLLTRLALTGALIACPALYAGAQEAHPAPLEKEHAAPKAEAPKPALHEEAAKPAPAAAEPARPARAARPAPREEAKAAPASHGEGGAQVFPGEALRELLAGNKRFVAGNFRNAHKDAARRAEVASSQHPFAILVSCSDSRVVPEILFDQGIGDLFVVRTAGEVVDDVALGSIEYAVEHLGASLIFVLGHERCGAVGATLAGGHAPGQIGRIVEAIAPAVEKAREKEGDALTNCVNANVKLVAEKIRAAEPIVSEKSKDGMVRVVGGYYDLDTGVVTIVYNPDLPL